MQYYSQSFHKIKVLVLPETGNHDQYLIWIIFAPFTDFGFSLIVTFSEEHCVKGRIVLTDKKSFTFKFQTADKEIAQKFFDEKSHSFHC